MKRYAYGWITAAFFLISIIGHWIFGWFAYVEEATQHQQVVQLSSYLIEMGRDTSNCFGRSWASPTSSISARPHPRRTTTARRRRSTP
jgi:hypothetical protein